LALRVESVAFADGAADEALELRDNEGNDSRQTSMNWHPITSGSSHLFEGCFWGYPTQTKIKKL
jgi:hypothetical protein